MVKQQDNLLLQNLDNPVELEHLYQAHPHQFTLWLTEALEFKESETLRVWQARLLTLPQAQKAEQSSPRSYTLFWVGVLSLISFALYRIPMLVESIDTNLWYFPRYSASITIGVLMIYFALKDGGSRKQTISLFGGFIGVALLVGFYPSISSSDSVVMALMYQPLLLLSFLGILFLQDSWKSSTKRLLFIRYLGEMVLYGALVLLGGGILTGLTAALFMLIHIPMEWYFENVVLLGVVATPLVATYLYDIVLHRQSKLTAIFANVFSPLFLILVSFYLVVLGIQGRSPFSDRELLITFNGLLLVVWAITVFSLAGKGEGQSSPLTDAIAIALVGVTLVVNAIALSSIFFRLITLGITVNRLVVTVSNLLLFIHLLQIMIVAIQHMRHKTTLSHLVDVIARYLPLYTLWAAVVVLVLPLLYGFR